MTTKSKPDKLALARACTALGTGATESPSIDEALLQHGDTLHSPMEFLLLCWQLDWLSQGLLVKWHRWTGFAVDVFAMLRLNCDFFHRRS